MCELLDYTDWQMFNALSYEMIRLLYETAQKRSYFIHILNVDKINYTKVKNILY